MLSTCFPQVSFHSVQQFQRKIVKITANKMTGFVGFPIGPEKKTQKVCTGFWVHGHKRAPEYPTFEYGHMLLMISSKTQIWKMMLRFASCRSLFNFVQRLQRRSRKCLSHWAPKTQTWNRTFSTCILSCFADTPSAVAEKNIKVSQPIRVQCSYLNLAIGLKHELDRGRGLFSSWYVSLNSVQQLQRSSK